MAIYDKLNQSMSDNNAAAYIALLHEDFVAVFHKTGNRFSKTEWAQMVTGMLANDKFIQDSSLCCMKMTILWYSTRLFLTQTILKKP